MTLILAAEMMARVASVSVVFGTLRYDGSQMAAGTAGNIPKSWKDNLAGFSYLLAELSSGKRVVRVPVIHGDLDLSDVALMISLADHHWSAERMRYASRNLHGVYVLWKRNGVGGSNHRDATSLHLAVHHSHDRYA